MPEECDGDIEIFKDECKRKETSKNELQEYIDTIKKIQDDIGKKLKEYGDKVPEFKDQRIKSKKYSDKWTPVIMAAIQSKKAELDKKIKPYKDKIDAIEKEIPQLEKDRSEALKQLKTSEIEFEEKNIDYEEEKEYITELIKLDDEGIIQGNLDKLEAWKGEIENAYDGDKPTMYGLILEFNRILDDTVIKERKELESDLYDSWKISNDAAKDMKEKEDKWEIAKNKLKSKKDDLKKLKEKLKDDIINITSENGQQGEAGKAESSSGESSKEKLKSQKES
jgi:hypothetical protein